MDKIVCTDVYTIPDTSWYKPVNVKNSPRERDEQAQRRKKLGWLPKRIRKHPKIQRIFGKPKKTKRKPKAPRKARRLKTRGDRFNQIVEQAYKSGKI
jgi:hypothetical protein